MKQHIVNIGEKAYIIYPFNFIEGKKIETKLLKYAAPVISNLLKAEDEGVGENKSVAAILDGIAATLDESNIDDFVQLQVDLLSKVMCNGGKVNIETEFQCEFDKALDLMKAVIDFNFKSVFQKLGIAVL